MTSWPVDLLSFQTSLAPEQKGRCVVSAARATLVFRRAAVRPGGELSLVLRELWAADAHR